MTAEQGIELLNTIKLQMNSVELEKFQKMILNQTEDTEEFEKKVDQCRVWLRTKHGKKKK